MALITTSSFAKAIAPGVNKWYGDAYKEYPVEWSKIFPTYKSKRSFEEDVGTSNLGFAAVKSQGGAITYDDMRQGFTTRYSHIVYGLGFIITREMYEDDLYGVIGKKKAKALARSMRVTKETIAANVLNRAFTSTYTGGDGKELCATDHPNVYGGTYANELTTASDLSEAALEQATIDIAAWTDDRGLLIAAKPTKLLIPPQLMFEAHRILKSSLRADTPNNDANALKDMGVVSDIVVNHYLTDADAWFLMTDVDDGLKHFERRPDQFEMDNDFDTENAKFKATGRYSFGWSDAKGIFGSPGA